MRTFSADIQLHSCLSPCGSLASSPRRICTEAHAKGVDIIALTDHNTAANCPAFATVAAQLPSLTAWYGVEVTSAEEVHVLCLFDDVDAAVAYGAYAHDHLTPGVNNAEYFGDQPIVDSEENIIAYDEALLIAATTLSIDSVVKMAHQYEGLAIAAHVDRAAHSVFSQLGLWPDDVPFDACDVSRYGDVASVRTRIPEGMPIVRSSDAHFPEDIGRCVTHLRMEAPTFEEFRYALMHADGRGIVYQG